MLKHETEYIGVNSGIDSVFLKVLHAVLHDQWKTDDPLLIFSLESERISNDILLLPGREDSNGLQRVAQKACRE